MLENKYQKVKRTSLFIIYMLLYAMINSCSSIDYYHSTPINKTRETIKKDEINLVTYNIKAIYDKEKYQIDSLIDFVHKGNFDFVLFQELFDESTRDEIVEKTDTNYFNTIISRVDYNSFPEFLFQDAGLFLMSKYPRVDLSNLDFGDDINNSNGVIHMVLEKEWSKTNDFLANKSVLGALFTIDDSTHLFLFTTHVQAIGTKELKDFQLKQIKNFIDTSVNGVIASGVARISKNLIVILAGDFNSNAYSNKRYNNLLKHLGYPRDLHKEYHGKKEEYTFSFRSGKPSRRFDYILAYDNVGEFSLRKISVKSIGAENIKDDTGNGISDHLALKAKLKIN